MPYSEFTLKRVVNQFNLKIIEEKGIFASIAAHPMSQRLAETLAENIPLAIAINTEKARSELIIANVLVELLRIFDKRISFFSGIEFNVDESQDLRGYCDFIISLTPEQMFLNAPVVTLVEAKNANTISGLGQCIAEMVAAQKFNAKEGNQVLIIYGAVTSGNYWQFMKLEDTTVSVDMQDYLIDDAGKILGILTAMINQTA